MNNILQKTEEKASAILQQLSAELTYHNYEHATLIVDAVQKIGELENLNEADLEIAQVAAWFQFTGYRDGHQEVSAKSKTIAQDFLAEEKLQKDKVETILKAIDKANERGGVPENKIEEVLLDANKITIKKEYFKSFAEGKRKELMVLKEKTYADIEWIEYNLGAVSRLTFYTSYGKSKLNDAKEKVQAKLEKQKSKFQKEIDESLINVLGVTATELKSMKKKLQKAEGRPERGIETMFRLTSKNHLDLSGMADSKANIMISVNSIIISILIGGLMQKLDTNPHLIVPTLILLTVNLVSIVYSIISIRPTVTPGLFTREDIENHRTNLLFFGNFHKMNREDYHWGMNQLMNNADYLYSSLIDDIYFLGVVLAKKYKYLRYSYNIFMIGIVIAVVAFVIANFMVADIDIIPKG
ncbi:MAG: putative metal-dependent HD superfamily phosphohydrolase [Polaribacter sp.]|jgi:predicted metal-dependent HD superfamily phosphohydrolase